MRAGIALLLAACAAAQPAPDFDRYPAGPKFTGSPAAPVLRTKRQRMFRTMIRDNAAKGPNFAGHYTVGIWGCGASCVSFAIVDARSGSVYDTPFEVVGFGAPFVYDDGSNIQQSDFEPVRFRVDSRLLVVRGCPGERDCASYYYAWTGTALKLVRKVPAKPGPGLRGTAPTRP
jgi:hypothetical protein